MQFQLKRAGTQFDNFKQPFLTYKSATSICLPDKPNLSV